jgi:hypothetical protein
MTKQILVILGMAMQFSLAECPAVAHPASGIVVNDRGEVFFVHTFRGVAKLDAQGKLSYVHEDTESGHWMCLDKDGSFSRTQPVHFRRITPEGQRPAIIYAAGGAPIAVCRDGNLYYGSGYPGVSDTTPGFLTVTRNSPDGKLTMFAPTLKEALHKLGWGVMGLAAGPDGFLYVADPSGILEVKTDGTVIPLVEHIMVDKCDEHVPSDMGPPMVRGLDVAADGTVFAAATGCRCVLKITAAGSVNTILRSERPWSPTGVALHNGDVYVLEYTDPNGDDPKGWRPRVRMLGRDGLVTTLVTLESGRHRSSQ